MHVIFAREPLATRRAVVSFGDERGSCSEARDGNLDAVQDATGNRLVEKLFNIGELIILHTAK